MKDKTLTCWIYFNIRENEKGKQWHKSYTQAPNRVKWYEEQDEIESSRQTSIFSQWGYEEPKSVYLVDILEDDCEDCEFDIENEKPICVNCFHDLEHDAFANYHCSGCDEWFSEFEVLRFRP